MTADIPKIDKSDAGVKYLLKSCGMDIVGENLPGAGGRVQFTVTCVTGGTPTSMTDAQLEEFAAKNGFQNAWEFIGLALRYGLVRGSFTL